MWILKKAVKIKTSLLDAKGKPIYEQREGGDPCPEASMWPKPELWCREVSDDGSDAKSAIIRYKERTGHDLGSYAAPNKDKEDAAAKVKLFQRLDELKGKGVAVEYSEADTMVILTKKVENAEKEFASSGTISNTGTGDEGGSADEGGSVNDGGSDASVDEDDFELE